MATRQVGEPTPLSDVVGQWVAAVRDGSTAERTPYTRPAGDRRKEFDKSFRRLIHQRDRWRCQWCAWSPFEPRHYKSWVEPSTMLQLDHIIPWASGGSDRSDNLRTLCDGCNERRSNYTADMHLVTVLPVVNWCDPCLEENDFGPSDALGAIDPIPVFCGSCKRNSITTIRDCIL
jgi:5-methylcytosine-specific restriction protein A